MAIRRAVLRLVKEGEIDLPPQRRTCHLMAKAAAAVLEAVGDGDGPPPPPRPRPRSGK